jgi:dGTPase
MDLPGSTPFRPVPARLAPYACHPEQSRGRRVPEPASPTRGGHQRDRDRIVHSVAFRRLKHKTQVFIAHEADHYRTRLTHSLEVAQIARSIARVLGLNEDLAEAVALAHDMGHPPFGHAGEEVLAAEMAPYGGFDHNEQTFRILTRLEHRYADFDGLNLTWETLEGIVKHNGPLTGPLAAGGDGKVPPSIAAYCREVDLELDGFPGAEAQVAALADDIAYNNHDIDDGLRAGLFTVEQLARPGRGALPRHRALAPDPRGGASADRPHGHRFAGRDQPPAGRGDAGKRRGAACAGRSGGCLFRADASERPRLAGLPVQAYVPPRAHHAHDRGGAGGGARPLDLFAIYMARPERLPEAWWRGAADSVGATRARLVADYIAGMTDRFAQEEHGKLLGRDGKI